MRTVAEIVRERWAAADDDGRPYWPCNSKMQRHRLSKRERARRMADHIDGVLDFRSNAFVDYPDLRYASMREVLRLARREKDLRDLISSEAEMQPWMHRQVRMPTADEQAGDWGDDERWGRQEERR